MPDKEYAVYEMLRLIVQLWDVSNGMESGLDIWEAHETATESLLPYLTHTEVLEIANDIIEELKVYYGES